MEKFMKITYPIIEMIQSLFGDGFELLGAVFPAAILVVLCAALTTHGMAYLESVSNFKQRSAWASVPAQHHHLAQFTKHGSLRGFAT
jgi:hypothetical protein